MRRFVPLLSLLLLFMLLPLVALAGPPVLTGCVFDADYARFTVAVDQPTNGTLWATVGGPELPAGDFARAGVYAFRLAFPLAGDAVLVGYIFADGSEITARVERGGPRCGTRSATITTDAPTIELPVDGPGWYQWGGWDAFGTAFDTGLRTQAEPTDDGSAWRVRLTLGEQGSRDAADWFVTAASP